MRSRSEAEDVVQEAFLCAWRARGTCRSPEAPLPWLLQITRNQALQAVRRPRPELLSERLPECAAEDPALAVAAERLDVRRALGDLSPEDRKLLQLRYGSDLTQPRVAEQLGLPEGTVKVRLHRLRSHLRLTLEGQP